MSTKRKKCHLKGWAVNRKRHAKLGRVHKEMDRRWERVHAAVETATTSEPTRRRWFNRKES